MIVGGLLNLGSLLFGLIAWGFPVVNLLKSNKASHKNWGILSMASISACAISLWMQIASTNFWVMAGDWAALLDTYNAIVFISAVLLAVTILLNVVTLAVYRKYIK